MNHNFDPPSTAEELDKLIHNIDVGEGVLASLSDEQRDQMREELTEAWLSERLDDYPVPADGEEAAREYREIESGRKYPYLPENARRDILQHFDERYGEGGPDHWPAPSGSGKGPAGKRRRV